MHAGPNAALLGEAKAHEAVLAAMRAHAGAAGVQELACAMLSNMTYMNGELLCARFRVCASQSKTTEDSQMFVHVFILVVHAGPNIALLSEAKAHEAVLAAMRAHAGVDGVQVAACRVLCYLAADNGELLCARFRLHHSYRGQLALHAGPNAALLGEAKAHEAVLAAMRAHAGAAGVQELACAMLSNMTYMNGELLCARFRVCASQSKTTEDSQMFVHVFILVVHAGPNIALLSEAKAHEAVLAAMRAHAGVAGVQEAACGVLCNLAADNGELLCARFRPHHSYRGKLALHTTMC